MLHRLQQLLSDAVLAVLANCLGVGTAPFATVTVMRHPKGLVEAVFRYSDHGCSPMRRIQEPQTTCISDTWWAWYPGCDWRVSGCSRTDVIAELESAFGPRLTARRLYRLHELGSSVLDGAPEPDGLTVESL
jgi:hypothetical protein